MLRLETYSEHHINIWNTFVDDSKNGTFLFYRDYMDYHRDRFVDHSLLIWDEKNHLVAILPASRHGSTVISHGGLTYGGFLTMAQMKSGLMLDIFTQTLGYLKTKGFEEFLYKAIPHFYHRVPAEEDRYALFRHGATLYRRDLTTTVVPGLKTKFQDRRLRGIRKAQNAGMTWGLSEDFEQFWTILENNLMRAHNLRPVHTLPEICRLHDSFPENIQLYCSFLSGDIVGGVVIYETHTVAHAQYIAISDNKHSQGALDYLFFHLIAERFSNKDYFNFGVSTEKEGTYLNAGLLEFKEGFGGLGFTHDFYRITL